jgi:hypothetical protein
VFRWVLQLAALRLRSSDFKELEIVLLRHDDRRRYDACASVAGRHVGGGRAARSAGQSGALKAGMLADIVAVPGNPLDPGIIHLELVA